MTDLTTSDGMVRAYPSTAVTWTGSGLHLVHLDSVDWDPDSCFFRAGGGTWGGYYYAVPTNGYYLLNGRVGATGTAAGDCLMSRIQANGVDVVRGTKTTLDTPDITNGLTAMVSQAFDLRYLNQGDQVQLYADLLFSAAPGLALINDKTRTYLNVIRLL